MSPNVRPKPAAVYELWNMQIIKIRYNNKRMLPLMIECMRMLFWKWSWDMVREWSKEWIVVWSCRWWWRRDLHIDSYWCRQTSYRVRTSRMDIPLNHVNASEVDWASRYKIALVSTIRKAGTQGVLWTSNFRKRRKITTHYSRGQYSWDGALSATLIPPIDRRAS